MKIFINQEVVDIKSEKILVADEQDYSVAGE